MMKRFSALVLAMLLLINAASATILPATGVDEDFLAWTGISCTPAVVLCESLTVLDERGDQGGKPVEVKLYSGKTIPVIESWDGYAKIYYSDGNKTGWVRNEYLMMNPAWYVCDEAVAVYAYPDTMAPRVALLEKGTELPILTEYDDGESMNGWVCVSLRAAAGWIRKTPQDTVNQTFFRPEMLTAIAKAQLTFGGDTYLCSDAARLDELEELLTHVEDHGFAISGCPFTAVLSLTLADGSQVDLQLATDSRCVYRIDKRDYSYARHLWSADEGSPDNGVLLQVFGLQPDAFMQQIGK